MKRWLICMLILTGFMIMGFPAVCGAHDEAAPGHRIVLYEYHFDFPLDKQKHTLAGIGIAAVSRTLGWKNELIPVGSAGVGKEVYDHFFGGTVDWQDALFTWIGGLVFHTLVRE